MFFIFSYIKYYIRNVMVIQNEDEDFCEFFGNSEGDLDRDNVLLLPEMECQAEEQQLKERQRECHHEAYNIEQECNKIL